MLKNTDPRTPFNVLVAEDNAINRMLIIKLLEKHGVTVESVCNGLEAIEALEANNYDLVLMDVQMPELDGLEATRRIRNAKSSYSKIPIVAVTANAMKDDKERCEAAGMNGYLTKPINRDALHDILRTWHPSMRHP